MLSSLSVYQISRQLDNGFVFCNNFYTFMKRRKKRMKKDEEIKPIFEDSYLGNAWHDLVEIWNVR